MSTSVQFEDGSSQAPVTSVGIDDIPGEASEVTKTADPYPSAILPMSDEAEAKFIAWIDNWLMDLKSSHQSKIQEWAFQEMQYRARSGPAKTEPFVGACNDVVPVQAMAIDPIHARLDTGIFKADPVIRIKALKKSMVKYVESLELWIEFYQKHKLELRKIVSPKLLEMTKHGTMIFKTVYDYECYDIMTYDKDWKPLRKKVDKFKGPRVFGIGINDFLFPPNYQNIQDCPFVAERQRYYPVDLKVLEKSGKLGPVKDIQPQGSTVPKDDLQLAREESANHPDNMTMSRDMVEVWEIWCDYDFDGDGLPERMVVTYHESTHKFLQRRYNWYFHQRKPYTLVPYSVANDSLYGVGIGEMTMFFQDAQTKWHQMATDNAYLANIRMFIAKKESGIEEVPKLYTGRTFFVDNPDTDFKPFQAAEVYPSTLAERQNLFGLAEKRTGVSDYLTGRESPIVGSRATATATTALIAEGTRRVEEVLENVRTGVAEIIQNCIYIWMQYGLDGLDELVFGNDKVQTDLIEFFDQVDADNVAGAFAFDLSATDAANNRSIQQQVQLAIIQTMMQYLDKLVQAGQLAISAAQQQPQLTALISAVMDSARKMFKDLLTKYDIRNPEDYLPDLEVFLSAATQGQGQPSLGANGAGGLPADAGLPSIAGQAVGAPFTGPTGNGSGLGITPSFPTAGQGGMF